jgi:hypothetical protein
MMIHGCLTLLLLILSISVAAFAAKGPQAERLNSAQDSGRHQLQTYFNQRQIDQLEEYEGIQQYKNGSGLALCLP